MSHFGTFQLFIDRYHPIGKCRTIQTSMSDVTYEVGERI